VTCLVVLAAAAAAGVPVAIAVGRAFKAGMPDE
jgi:hypothetical protein